MTDPIFLTLEQVLELHRRSLEEHGGQDGIRDLGLVESAIAVPASSYDGQFLHVTLFDMAAAYAYHLAENQPFVDGNKRVAISATLVFLKLNGIDFDADAVENPLYDAMIKMGTRRLSKTQMAELLRTLSTA